jgi:hypothetical protein
VQFTLDSRIISIREDPGTNKLSMSVPQLTSDYSLVLPNIQGTFDSALVNNGYGNLSWVSLDISYGQYGSKLVGTGSTGAPLQGWSVSLYGDTLAVGGPEDNSNVGATWVFTRNAAGVWTQQGSKLVGSGAIGASRQGTSVSLYGDTLAVGGRGDNGFVGATWVFIRSGGSWAQQGPKLLANDSLGTPGLGGSVSLDGDSLAVGGSFDNSGEGAVWVYTRSGGSWAQQGTKLLGTGAVGSTIRRGFSVSLYGDTLAFGGYADNFGKGAVWVFTRSGGSWTQQGSKLVGSGAADPANQGSSVSLDRDTLAVGGQLDGTNVGATWVFTRSGGTWTQQGSKLVGTGVVGDSNQGISVSLYGDTLAVGGDTDDFAIGATWVFTRSNGVWTQKGSKLVGTGASGASRQGSSVFIDGYNIAISGRLDDGGIGATWIFEGYAGVSSVSGTTDRITSSGGQNPIIDIASTYVGQTSITTLGTIGTGTWNGSVITGTYGGTGVNNGSRTLTTTDSITIGSTGTTNQLMYISTANNITGLATGNNGTLITSAGGVPSISSTLPSAVQGNITTLGTIGTGTWNATNIALNRGGTGSSLSATNGTVLCVSGGTGAQTTVGTTGQLLLSAGTSTPTWSNTIPNATSITNATASTSTTTGSLINAGGFGNAGAIFTNTLNSVATTASTSTTTGSIISAGGIGCAGRVFTNDITISTPNYSLMTFFSGVSITNATWTNPFTGGIATRTDSGSACSSTTSGVVTIATSGVYTITYGAGFLANITGIRGYRIRFTTGSFVGQTIIGTVLVDAVTTASFNTEYIWSISIPLVAGNVIIMEIFQNSSGSLNSINNVYCVSRQI